MEIDKNPSKQRKREPSKASEARSDLLKIMDIRQIRMHPTFEGLLPISEGLLGSMTRDMKDNGFYDSEPLVLGWWSSLTEPVLIDGHARLRAALEAGITEVPLVIKEFPDEVEALQHAMNLQSKRRTTTDGALYRLSARYDRLMDRGGDRRSEEAEELLTRVSKFVGRSASARRTASLIGCNYKKVDKIRKIRKDGTPEIQEAVKNDKLSINGAYKLIRDMELGREEDKDKESVRHIRAAKILFSEENYTILKELGGDVSTHLNRAVEMYVRWHQDKERSKET